MKRSLSAFALVVLSLAVSGCTQTASPEPSPSPVFIPFAVVFDVEFDDLAPLVDYPPTVRVIQSPGEVDGQADRLGPFLRDQLKPINFEQQVAVVLLHGTTDTTGYDITLQDVQVSGTTVELHANWGRPTPDEPVGALVTSPALGVTIQRDRLPAGQVAFLLLDGSQERARTVVDISPAP